MRPNIASYVSKRPLEDCVQILVQQQRYTGQDISATYVARTSRASHGRTPSSCVPLATSARIRSYFVGFLVACPLHTRGLSPPQSFFALGRQTDLNDSVTPGPSTLSLSRPKKVTTVTPNSPLRSAASNQWALVILCA